MREAKAGYSASDEDLETVVCFLDFQEIKDVPLRMEKPETKRRVVAQEAQSEYNLGGGFV